MSKFALMKKALAENYTAVLVVYAITVVAVSMQVLLSPLHLMENSTDFYITNYNNYVIFRQSFFHLIHGQDLYAWYLDEYWDLYKYSPAFALFFGLFAWLPDSVGLILWNGLNTACLFMAIRQLPQLTVRAKVLLLLFILIESITALQNSQSNALIAGLLILAFVNLETDRTLPAVIFVSLSVFIKLFGLVGFGLFLFYPNRLKAAIAAVICIAILSILPAVVIPFDQLSFQYVSWYQHLLEDHTFDDSLSFMNWLNSWFTWYPDRNLWLAAGLIGLGVPFLRWRCWTNYTYRLLILSSILLWVVLFNHKAESPTFIIAMAGVGIWYFARSRKWMDTVLLLLALVFTSLSTTDIFPRSVQHDFLVPLVIKAVPCIMIWVRVTIELLTLHPTGKFQESGSLGKTSEVL